MRIFLIAILAATSVFAQGTKADYERSQSLARRTDGLVFRTIVTPNWQGGGDAFWYRVETGPGTHEFVFVDCVKETREPAFDHAKLAAALGGALKRKIEPGRLPVERLDVNAAEDRVRFRSEGRSWEFVRGRAELRELPAQDEPEPGRNVRAPGRSRTLDDAAETSVTFINRTDGEVRTFWMDTSGRRVPYATVKPGETHEQHTFEGHVWLAETVGGASLGTFEAERGGRQIVLRESAREQRREKVESQRESQRDTETRPEWRPFLREHNVWLRHRDTGEEVQLSRDGKAGDRYREPLLLSPDGSRLLCQQEIPEQAREVYFVESSPKDQIQPKLHKQQYLKPGDRIAHRRPRLFDVPRRAAIALDEALFARPWNIQDLRWERDSSRFTFLYNERGHQVLRIVAVSRDGVARALVEEKSATFVDYSQKTWMHWLDETSELLWASERDGWNHLYLFDARTGSLKNQVTRGEFVVRGVARVDAEKRQLWLRVMGAHRSQDPYHLHFARVNFDGSGFTLLTDGDGTRRGGRERGEALPLSPNGRWLVDTYSRVDLPPVTELRDAQSGRLVCVLEKADATGLAATGWSAPERFSAPGRDGKTEIHGIIIRPTNFDPAKKYPVIEEIYAGPHGFFVPKEWGRQSRQRAMAELGFIIVQIDGMGTNWRSKAFHDVAWRNLMDAGFPDRIAWLRAAAATRPWMDLGRVGIYGGSAGGQNALSAMLHHGDFYKAAVADCGCHDNRMDKIWWNEAWMGEVGPHYAENSNVTHAGKLRGKLMLIVGEMDTNVDPASTMQVANALVKADKDFDLLVMPGTGHGAAETPYASRRRMDFFVRHLHGIEPRQ